MKRVVNSETVAHLWANQVQSDARNGCGSMFFDNDTIYSYGLHFPMAKHVTNSRGDGVVLFTSRSYSVSTSKHQNYTRRAASHLDSITVDKVTNSARENFEAFEKDVRNFNDLMSRARSNKSYYFDRLESIETNIRKYAAFYDLELPESLETSLSVRKSADVKAALAAQAELDRLRRENHEANEAKKFAESLRKWREFETLHLSRFDGKSYLRFNPVSNRVQTSQGVEMNYSTAKQLFFSIRDAIKTQDFQTLIGQSVLNYTVSDFDEKRIVIGCHRIDLTEVFDIAKSQGWEVH